MDHVGVLKDLISIDTTVPPGNNYGKAIEYLEPLFKQVGFQTEQVTIPEECAGGKPGRVNLLAHRRNRGKPRLIFYTHVDVVPAQGWSAFDPVVRDGKVYGRGAADMKGGIVALLLGMEKISRKQIKYDVSVMVTTDEEVGQAEQIRYLGRSLEPVEGASVFSLDSDFGYVSIADLGAIHMDVKVRGESVHSAMSHLGQNAIEKAIPLLNALMDLKPRVMQRHSKVDAHPSTGLRKMESRLNINVIRGGLKVNIVPDECTISIDRRLIPEERIDEARDELMQALYRVRDVRWEVDNIVLIPTVPPFKGSAGDDLAATIKQVVGEAGKYGTMGSGDFGPIVASDWRAGLFGLGVIRPECNIHGKNEFVFVKDIEQLAEIIAKFVSAP
ncbi:MAG: M20/M25/M40 family metallo-hydrolase [Chloroflexi bacterium]|nr:M20/M25/M40 family metallo-hydrolase [Chloroflexota bacterium]